MYKRQGEVRASQITATVDISGLTEANEYDLPVTVSVSKSGVETNYVNPGKVHVRVDRVESKDVPIEVNVTGTPSDGYRAGKPTAATKKVTVFGPATDLAQVAKAVAAVDVTGRNSSLTNYECRITLYDQDGAAFTSNYITSQTEKIKVSVPIYRVNKIPLTVILKDGGSLTQNQVQCVIDPENVEVIASDQAVLSDIKEINLCEIDLGLSLRHISNSAGVVRHSTQTLVLIMLVTLVVMLVISFMISQHVTRPLKTIAAAAKEFAGGNFDVRVPEDNRCYEIDELAVSFNNMARDLDQLEELTRGFISSGSHGFKRGV